MPVDLHTHGFSPASGRSKPVETRLDHALPHQDGHMLCHSICLNARPSDIHGARAGNGIDARRAAGRSDRASHPPARQQTLGSSR